MKIFELPISSRLLVTDVDFENLFEKVQLISDVASFTDLCADFRRAFIRNKRTNRKLNRVELNLSTLD